MRIIHRVDVEFVVFDSSDGTGLVVVDKSTGISNVKEAISTISGFVVVVVASVIEDDLDRFTRDGEGVVENRVVRHAHTISNGASIVNSGGPERATRRPWSRIRVQPCVNCSKAISIDMSGRLTYCIHTETTQ